MVQLLPHWPKNLGYIWNPSIIKLRTDLFASKLDQLSPTRNVFFVTALLHWYLNSKLSYIWMPRGARFWIKFPRFIFRTGEREAGKQKHYGHIYQQYTLTGSFTPKLLSKQHKNSDRVWWQDMTAIFNARKNGIFINAQDGFWRKNCLAWHCEPTFLTTGLANDPM